ncbi:MAG: quinone oxidoreductase [Planctomycetes bacterium]|nr:quinone oxidoreductase [Planctomycetota bacterium]MDP6409725.1 quinone oxidoreductase [Planctomycetota bacterium]
MHCIRVHEPGGAEVLRWEACAPGEPGRGEALVRHTAVGLNFIDVYFRTALYPPPGYPFVPGIEAAGVVEEVGEAVSDLAVGDRVAYACRPLGAYSEARVLPADRLLKLPAQIDDELAAGSTLKGLTAHYLLRRTFPVQRGQTILVHAAAGGVGSLVCQWAAHLGARVIGTVGSDEKAARAAEDGCDHPIVYTREDFAARVRELTDGRGIDVVYDSVGAATFTRSLDCLRPMGMMVSFGQSSGPVGDFSLGELASRGSLIITRPSLMDYSAAREDLVAGFEEFVALLVSGVLRCRVEQRFGLREAAAAHRALERRETVGSTVLIPPGAGS